jgi:hypothetical protein
VAPTASSARTQKSLGFGGPRGCSAPSGAGVAPVSTSAPGVRLGVGVGLSDDDGDSLGIGVWVCDGAGVGVSVGVGVGVSVGVWVGVGVGRPGPGSDGPGSVGPGCVGPDRSPGTVKTSPGRMWFLLPAEPNRPPCALASASTSTRSPAAIRVRVSPGCTVQVPFQCAGIRSSSPRSMWSRLATVGKRSPLAAARASTETRSPAASRDSVSPRWTC